LVATSPVRSTPSTKNGFDANTLRQAKEILQANNEREAAQALANVVKDNNTKKPFDASLKNDETWTPQTSNGRLSSASIASSISPGSSVSQRVPNQPVQAAPVGPLIAPLLGFNPHNTFVPTSLGNPGNSVGRNQGMLACG
jgi:hypothetical protein